MALRNIPQHFFKYFIKCHIFFHIKKRKKQVYSEHLTENLLANSAREARQARNRSDDLQLNEQSSRVLRSTRHNIDNITAMTIINLWTLFSLPYHHWICQHNPFSLRTGNFNITGFYRYISILTTWLSIQLFYLCHL